MPPTRRIRKSISLRKEASTLGTLASVVLGVSAVAAMLLLNGEAGGAGDAGAGGDATGGAAGAGAAAGGGQGAAGAPAAGGAAAGGASGDDEDDEPLGPKGVRALEAEKQKNREVKAELARVRQENEELAAKNKTAEERALDQARNEGKQLAESETQPRLARLELENAILRHVGAKFADPDDAVMNLGSDTMRAELFDDGQVDIDKLTKAAEALLAKKPHLAAGAAPGAGSAARPNQGANGTGGAQPDPAFLDRMKATVEARTGVK